MDHRFALILALVASCSRPAAVSEPPPPALVEVQREETPPKPTLPPEAGCLHRVGEDSALLEFDAFGPPSMSFALLGQAWWQWDAEGHAFEEQGGTVWIVVHQNVAPDDLAVRFPVRQADACDHRYVTVDEAILYLEDHIAELDGVADDVPELLPVLEQLRRTRAELLERFGR